MSTIYVAPPDSLEEVLEQIPIREVHIDGLAVMKIAKHCNDNIPSMVTGSLLGLDVDGVLEVTYAYPFPAIRLDGEGNPEESTVEGQEYQIEMMKMLRDIHLDNNCVGWYQTMYMGTLCTNQIVGYQYSYQSTEELSDNSVVILYDPVQSKKGSLALKAFRLSEDYIRQRKYKLNEFIKPDNILEEIPIKITSIGHVSAFIRCLQDTHSRSLNCDFDHLKSTGSDAYLEKNLELTTSWLDDLNQEQAKTLLYTKHSAKARQEHLRWVNKRISELRDGESDLNLIRMEESGLKPLPESPLKIEPLLMIGQLEKYTKQMNEHVDMNFHKLFISTELYTPVAAGTGTKKL